MAKKMALMPSGQKVPNTALVAYQEYLNMPPGSTPIDLARTLKQKHELMYNTLKESALRVQIYRWMKDFGWEREMLEHSLASRGERVRLLNQLAIKVYELTTQQLEEGKIPDKGIAQLRGLLTDINVLVEGGKESQATMNVELMIKALEQTRPNPAVLMIEKPPYADRPDNQ